MNIYAVRTRRYGPDLAYIKARDQNHAHYILRGDLMLSRRFIDAEGKAKYGLHFVGRVPSGYDDSPGIVD